MSEIRLFPLNPYTAAAQSIFPHLPVQRILGVTWVDGAMSLWVLLTDDPFYGHRPVSEDRPPKIVIHVYEGETPQGPDGFFGSKAKYFLVASARTFHVFVLDVTNPIGV